MKSNYMLFAGALATAAYLTLAPTAPAQAVATTTTSTETAGTISNFGNDTIVVRSETSPAPITYHYSKTTTYVDDTGAPVSIETVKSGLPVTVHYIKEGDNMVANRVIVHKRKVTTETTPATVEEKHTTTTTTTTEHERK